MLSMQFCIFYLLIFTNYKRFIQINRSLEIAIPNLGTARDSGHCYLTHPNLEFQARKNVSNSTFYLFIKDQIKPTCYKTSLFTVQFKWLTKPNVCEHRAFVQ